MKDTSRQPTKLVRLQQLIDPERESDGPFGGWGGDDLVDIQAWLEWTYNFLSARKMYHKKARITQAMLVKMSKTLLSKDELEAIDAEAEKQLVNLEDEQIPMELMEREADQ